MAAANDHHVADKTHVKAFAALFVSVEFCAACNSNASLGPSCTGSYIDAAPVCFVNAEPKGNLLSAHLLIRDLLKDSQGVYASMCK